MSALETVHDAIRNKDLKLNPNGRMAQCPAHNDRAPSLSIGAGTKFEGVMLYCHAGCATADITAALGLTVRDLFDQPRDKGRGSVEVARYPYTDDAGTVLFSKIRNFPKGFLTLPKGAAGALERKPLYMLPDVLAAAEAGGTVYLVEGEKDADRLAALGQTATCNHDGAGKFTKTEYADYLKGATVVVIADRDEPGYAHAAGARDLLEASGIVCTVVEAAAGKDVSDHLNAGHSLDELVPVTAVTDSQPEDKAGAGKGLKLRRATELELPPPTKWIARGWLPRREITVMVGEEGIGKSLLWVLFAAHVTTGRAFEPFGLSAREPADVVVVVTEDSASEVTARLELAGADMGRIIFYAAEDDGSGTPIFGNGFEGDMLLLDGLLEELESKPALLVVDAWLDTVAGNLNIRDTQQARQALHPWKQLATRHDLAAMLITHTNRMDTTSTRDLMGGTAALRQKARMVLFAARSKQDYDGDVQHLWVGPDKSNVTGLVDAVKFTVAIKQVRPMTDDDPGTTAHLTAPASALATIRNLLASWKHEEMEADRKPTKAEEAGQAIQDYMRSGTGDVLSADVKEHLRAKGYGKSTTEEAMRALGTSAPKDLGGKWFYKLDAGQSSYPEPVYQEPIESKTSKNTSEYGDAGLLAINKTSYSSYSSYSSGIQDHAKNTGDSQNQHLASIPVETVQTGGPDQCATCSHGKPTEANIDRGIFQCLNCIRKETA